MQGINRIVIYQNRLNITDLILDTLNRGTPAAAQDARPRPDCHSGSPQVALPADSPPVSSTGGCPFS